MAANTLVDAGFLVALLSRRDAHHPWAVSVARRCPPPWQTCDAVLSEACHLLGQSGAGPIIELLRRQAVAPTFDLRDHLDSVLRIMEKYADVPASLAGACLVRMADVVADPVVLTTDGDFRVYRRQGRRVVPTVMPVPPDAR